MRVNNFSFLCLECNARIVLLTVALSSRLGEIPAELGVFQMLDSTYNFNSSSSSCPVASVSKPEQEKASCKERCEAEKKMVEKLNENNVLLDSHLNGQLSIVELRREISNIVQYWNRVYPEYKNGLTVVTNSAVTSYSDELYQEELEKIAGLVNNGSSEDAIDLIDESLANMNYLSCKQLYELASMRGKAMFYVSQIFASLDTRVTMLKVAIALLNTNRAMNFELLAEVSNALNGEYALEAERELGELETGMGWLKIRLDVKKCNEKALSDMKSGISTLCEYVPRSKNVSKAHSLLILAKDKVNTFFSIVERNEGSRKNVALMLSAQVQLQNINRVLVQVKKREMAKRV